MHWMIYERGMEFGWIFVLIFSVLVVLGIVHLVGLMRQGKRKKTLREGPLDILKIRYAKGEITKEEFAKMREDITKS